MKYRGILASPWVRAKVYISGPITLGDTHRHVHDACRLWQILWYKGFWPVCPHWSALQAMIAPVSYDEWMEYDMEQIRDMDAVLRFGGESKGADKECAKAAELGIPVFKDFGALITYAKGKKWI